MFQKIAGSWQSWYPDQEVGLQLALLLCVSHSWPPSSTLTVWLLVVIFSHTWTLSLGHVVLLTNTFKRSSFQSTLGHVVFFATVSPGWQPACSCSQVLPGSCCCSSPPLWPGPGPAGDRRTLAVPGGHGLQEDWRILEEDWGRNTEDWGLTTEDWGLRHKDWGMRNEAKNKSYTL